MMKFGLKDLLCSITLISMSLAAIVRFAYSPGLVTALFFSWSGSLMGLAIGGLFRKPELGLVLGFGLTALFAFIIGVLLGPR